MILLIIIHCLVVIMHIDAAVDQLRSQFDIRWAVGELHVSEKSKRAQQYVISCDEHGELLFAIYDGHAGPEAASIAAHGLKSETGSVDPLHALIVRSKNDYPFSHKEAYKIMDKAICEDKSHESGTSAITCHLQKSGVLTYSFVGSSSILLIEKNTLFATVPHTIENQMESERVKQSEGGSSFLEAGKKMSLGSRTFTRSLGDKTIKDCVKGIIAEPSVHRVFIKENGCLNCEGFVIATRSLWDVVERQEVDSIVYEALRINEMFFDGAIDNQEYKGNSSRAINAAKALLQFARSKGCASDTTLIVVNIAERTSVIYAIEINEDDLNDDVPLQPKENAVERSFNPRFVAELQRRLAALQNQY